jgi:hypothetical protein
MNEKDIKTKSDKEDSEDFQFNIDYHKEEDEDFDEDIPYFKVHEENSEDPENEVDNYFCIFKKYDTKEVEETDVNFP